MSSRFRQRARDFRDVAVTDYGTPTWFVILMAIFTVLITIAIIGIFATNNKIKKNAGYKGGGGSTTTTTAT